MKKFNYSNFAIILMLASIGQVVSDIYLPSLPYISSDLDVSVRLIQLSLFTFMLGLSISQLFYGPISDAIGRKAPLLVGISICIAGCVLVMFVNNIYLFNLSRFIQGVGAGAGLALSRSILRDLYYGKNLAKVGSYLSIINIGIMASAPFIGAYLQSWFNWRANFIFLSLYAICILIILISLYSESNKYADKKHLQLINIKTNTKRLFSSKVFLVYTLIIFFTYAGILAWLTSGPILLQHLGISTIGFGKLSILVGGIYTLGSLTNVRLLKVFSLLQALSFGIAIITVSSLVYVLLCLILTPNAYVVIVCVLAFIFGTSIIMPNSYAKIMSPFGDIAGITGAIIGCIQILGGCFASYIISLLPTYSSLSMATFMLFCSILIVILLYATHTNASKD